LQRTLALDQRQGAQIVPVEIEQVEGHVDQPVRAFLGELAPQRLEIRQAARCRKLRASVTFIAVMMRSNYDRFAEIAEIVKAYESPLRINVYLGALRRFRAQLR
jgi:hypothetical protein